MYIVATKTFLYISYLVRGIAGLKRGLVDRDYMYLVVRIVEDGASLKKR